MRLRSIVRIARWEITVGNYFVDRRTLFVTILVLGSLVVLLPVVFSIGVPHDEGIYLVGIDDADPYVGPVNNDHRLARHPPSREAFRAGELDILVTSNDILVQDTSKGRAAADSFATAIESHNTRLMREEPNQSRAFPVQVELRYVDREFIPIEEQNRGGGADNGGASGEGSTGTETATQGSNGSSETVSTDQNESVFSGQIGLPSVQAAGALFGQSSGSPTDINPPFPFVSLVLAFVFVIPMNFVIQAYASSILHERENRRGELLLVTPLSRVSIVLGKTLPYFLIMLVIALITTVFLGGGVISLSATVPMALLFLGSGFLAGLLARSHKELSFLLVTISVGLTTFVFVPAIFINIHPIASISPLTPIVHDLEGTTISLSAFVFATVPLVVVAGMLFAFGIGMYREEDLFAQRSVGSKLLDALANFIKSHRSALLLSIAMIPFVFVFELLAVSMLFVFPIQIGLPVLFIAIAVIEEIAKSIHIYAGFQRGKYTRSLRSAMVIGGWSGTGFFIAEKGFLVVQLVGLEEMDLGRYAFEASIGVGDASFLLLPILFISPLVLHTATAMVSAAGALRGSAWYFVGLSGAVLLHTIYNLTMVSFLV